MHFYKKIAIALIVVITVFIFLTGMSNFEESIGAPTLLEVKLAKNLRQSQYRSYSINDLLIGDNAVEGQQASNKNVNVINSRFVTPRVQEASNNNREEELLERLERVKGLCKSFHLGNYTWPNGTNTLGIKDPITPLYSYFFHDSNYKLAWCPVYKAGSTTWLYNMMILKGYSVEFLQHPLKQLSVLANEIFQDVDPGKEFNEAFKLLVVRHPFQRLISAYKDKLSNSSIGFEHGTQHFYEKYGKKIVAKFRQDHKILQKEPTFEEFVRYLIKTDLVYYADDHWLPAYLSCTPCRVSYDFIAKVETYWEDQQFLIDRKLHLSGIIQPRWQHSSGQLNDLNNKQAATPKKFNNNLASNTHQYFFQLTKQQITDLYKKYYLDFELFGYSYEEYLKLAKDSL